MDKKHISVKVRIDSHHREILIPAHRFISERYPTLNLCFHRTIQAEKPGSDQGFFLSKKRWTLTNIDTGLAIFSGMRTKIELEIKLYDLINEIGINQFNAKIEMAKKSMPGQDLESVLWFHLHRRGCTLTQTEIFDLINELKDDGVDMIYYAVEEKISP